MEPTDKKACLTDDGEDLPEWMTAGTAAKCGGHWTTQEALDVFNASFMDYEFARIWVLKRLHPAGSFCPRCGVAVPDHKQGRFWANERLSCRACGKYFTALTDTFIAGCHLDFRNLVLLSVLLALGIHDKQIAAITGMCPDNVRIWKYKFARNEDGATEDMDEASAGIAEKQIVPGYEPAP